MVIADTTSVTDVVVARDRDQKIEALRKRLVELRADQQLAVDELRTLEDQKAAETCPFAVGDEIERTVRAWTCSTPRVERWLILRIVAKYGGVLVCRRIIKGGVDLGRQTRELYWKGSGLTKVGHRSLDAGSPIGEV